MAELTPADDHLHPPGSKDRWWTETCWFSFDQPGEDLSLTVYPLFRPNQGVCSLAVALWDGSAHEPWAVPYHRAWWHLPMPTTELTALSLEGLRYECLEPLRRYRVAFTDGDEVELDLEWTGLRAAHLAFRRGPVGHLDQPCRVEGSVRVRGRTIAVDTLGMRDRTWAPRPDDARRRATAYTYGNASADEQFLVLTSPEGNEARFIDGVFTGYLVRDGEPARLVDASRRVVERRHGYPVRFELEATDALGRQLEAVGVAHNRLANQATPALFAWMSFVTWTAGGSTLIGEDQEVWTPDLLGPTLRALDC